MHSPFPSQSFPAPTGPETLCDVMPGKCCLTCTAPGQACCDSIALRRAEKRTLAEEEQSHAGIHNESTSIFQLQVLATPPQNLMATSLSPKTLIWSYPNSSGYAAGVCSDRYSINNIGRIKLQLHLKSQWTSHFFVYNFYLGVWDTTSSPRFFE